MSVVRFPSIQRESEVIGAKNNECIATFSFKAAGGN